MDLANLVLGFACGLGVGLVLGYLYRTPRLWALSAKAAELEGRLVTYSYTIHDLKLRLQKYGGRNG